MSLKESYLGNAGNIRRANPGAELIEVTRSAGSVLGPSWALLNDYKAKKITWDGYIERFVKEMDNPVSKAEMLRIGNLAKTRDVYLVCFERVGNCHRFLLVDMINTLTMEEAGRQVNRVVAGRPDLVDASYNNIAKALRVEA